MAYSFAVRWLSAFVLTGAIMAPTAWSAADEPFQPEPPVRLKKKKAAQPPAEPAEQAVPEKAKPADDKHPDAKIGDKKEEKKKGEMPKLRRPDADEPPEPTDDGEEAKETVARISRNMRAAEERLAKKDPGDATRGIQRDILKDLDKLIEENKRQQQQQQEQGGSASRRRQLRQQKQNASGQKKDSRQNARRGQKPQNQSAQKEGQAKGKPGQGGGGNSPKESSKIADLYKDIWGHLPETMRQEMDTYSREQFMERYKGLLKQYYSTLSEKGRGKGND